ncbi:MAG: hypothetical protein KY442_01180 [Proteobacteria bacterium]|nr:hypothetical protein [Pseudomonadota bacterium]
MPLHDDNLLKRGAVGFWFCAIGAVGLLRFYLGTLRADASAIDAVAWTWLIGSAVISVAGIVLVVRAVRSRP